MMIDKDSVESALAPARDASSASWLDLIQRLVNAGNRLTSQRDLATLPQFVLDEFVELSGAERAFVALCAETDGMTWAATRGIPDDEVGAVHAFAAPILAQAQSSGKPVLRSAVDEVPPDEAPPDEAALNQRSAVALPLVARGRLWGLLYGDTRRINGRFTQSDLDLLGLLADQAAAALENADWSHSLRQELAQRTAELQAVNEKLAQRTADLEQRDSELAVISGVQQALAAELDMQAIYDLVGDQIRDIFDAQVVLIGSYDHDEEMVYPNYFIEKGKRLSDERTPFNSLHRYLIRTRQPVLINERSESLMAEFGLRIIGDTEVSKSLLFVPLVVGETAKGYVSLQNVDREHAFADSDVRLLTTLANSMSVALQNARLFSETQRLLEETQQRNGELAVISSVQQALAAELHMQAIYELIGDQVRDIFDAQVVIIATFDHEAGVEHFNYLIEKGAKAYPEPRPLDELRRHLVRTRQLVWISENSERTIAEYGLRVVPGTEVPSSLVFVPLVVGEAVKGYVSLQNVDREHAFSESDVRLLTTLANSMSVALENARLFDETNRLLEETQQRSAELATVNTVSQALASELDLETLIQLIGEQMRQIFAADIVYIALHDPQTDMIHFPYGYGDAMVSIRFGEGLASRIIQSSRPLLVNQDVAGHHDELQIEHIGLQAKSYLGVPILVGQRAIGVISVQSTQVEGRFDTSDVDLLSTIAANVGAAIQNAQLYRESQRRADEMAALAEIGREISATLDLDIVLERIAAYARRLLLGDDSAVFLCETEGQTLRAIVALGDIAPQLKALSIPLGQGIIGDLALRGEAEIINDVPHDPRTMHIPGTLAGTEERLLAAPLLSREHVIGMMAVWRERGSDLFTQADLDFLVGLARQATIAMANARLFAEVQRQKQYFEALVANSPVAIVTIDLEGKGETWNPAAEKLFGYTQEEAFRQQIDDLVASADDIYSEARDFSQRIARGQPIRAITRRTCKSGILVDVELFAEPVIVDGKQVGIIAIYHDITELLQARREAEAANHAKSVFLANMSHELRTPLNAIIGFSRIVRRKGTKTLPQRQLENLDKVLVSAEHLLGLINAVLDIAKIEAGRMDVQPSSFDPAVLLEVCATMVHPMVKASVRLVKQIEPDLPQAYSDQDKLKQILFNLLSNAAKFTHEGRITLGAKRRDEMLVVDVIDTGIGISQQALERIFEEFQQADATTTRQYGGTGLGLSISRKLARLLGGDLTATSAKGKGSTFTLTIPLRYGGLRADDAASQSGVLTTQPSPGMRKPVLLAIDDDPDVIYLLRESLGEAGYLVVGATSGDEGVHKAQELRPFAITLDVMMPHKDGWQVLHELKAHPETQDIPVIMLTIVDKKALGYRLGAADYLLKPLNEGSVLDALQRLAPAKGPKPCSRLLVVDDDPQVADMVRQLLDESVCEVEAVADGREALEAVARQRPDIILLDLRMPRLDGFGVIEQLQQDPDYRDIPVVVLTAKTLNVEERTLLEQSVSQILRKQGLEAEVLIQELQKALVS